MTHLSRLCALLSATLLLTVAFGPVSAQAQDAFITTWEATSAKESVTIPTSGDSANGGSASKYDVETGRSNGSPKMTAGENPIPDVSVSQRLASPTELLRAPLPGDGKAEPRGWSTSTSSVSFVPFDAGLSGVGSSSTSIADVNGDGAQDFLITGNAGTYDNPDLTATLYLGDGQGGFSEAGAGLTGVFAGSTSIADVNGDGAKDLLITGNAGTYDNEDLTATLYLGDGQGGFSEAGADLTGVSAGSSSIADVDGDGAMDLLITGEDANNPVTTTLYLGDGQGGFSEAGADLTGVDGSSTSIADVDGDGAQDLLITGRDANNNMTATLYLGDGQGGFSEAGAYLTGVHVSSTSIADVDGDGAEDLLITGSDALINGTPTATLYLGDGQGGFSEADAGLTGVISLGSNYTSIADVDGDGAKDLLITGQDENDNLYTATLYLGDGQGSFSEAGADLTGVGAGSNSIADVDGDGAKDLLITGLEANDNRTATLYENQSAPSAPLSISIEGTRITPQTLPSVENTPENAVPYPPNTKQLRDKIEVVRYPADRIALRARVRLDDSFDGSVEDVSVEGTLGGETMQIVIRDSVDADEDGKIDTLPFDHYRAGEGTEYADVLLISSQDLQSGVENLSLDVSATTASGVESQASEEVSLYYAKREGGGRSFDPQTDGYRFENLLGLSFGEVKNLLGPGNVVGAPLLAFYGHKETYEGRCFGMAGTAGVYFDEPGKKVFSGETYQQPKSDAETRQRIAEYHLAQDYSGVNDRLSSPDFSLAYGKAKNILKEYSETPMIGVEYGSEPSRHAILATNLTVLQTNNEAVFGVYDSNIPSTTYDLSYDTQNEDFYASISKFDSSYMNPIAAITTVNVDGVPFLPDGDWYRKVYTDLIYGVVGKMFGAYFTSSGGNSQTTPPTTKENFEWETTRVLVENDQGQQSGYLSDGTKVNEISGAVVKQVVTDSAAGEKATYVTVPPGEMYTASIAASDDGNVSFEHALPTEDSTAEVNWAEGIAFTSESSGTYNESDKQIELDEDGDGTVDETIPTESTTIPVELASLDAYAEGDDRAVLTWQTASEQNNAGFEVQHQAPDSERWRTLGFVDSKASGGTTSETNTYRYAAEDLAVGTHRFRLRQVDLDGTSDLTDPVTVDIQMQEALKLTAPAPNPASNSATLSFAVKEQSETTLRLYNTLGQQVATLYEGTSPAGEQQAAQVDVSSLPSGTYFVRLRADGQTRTRRLTVVR